MYPGKMGIGMILAPPWNKLSRVRDKNHCAFLLLVVFFFCLLIEPFIFDILNVELQQHKYRWLKNSEPAQ